MTSTSHDVNDNDVKNGNDVGVKNGDSIIISMQFTKTGSMKIHNYRQKCNLKKAE